MKPTLALRSFLLGSISLAVSPLIHAANIWDGGGADNNSNTALNWDNNAVPAANAQLTFAGIQDPTVVWNGITGASINVSGFTFSAGAAAFQINSGTANAVQFIANGTSTLLNSSSNLQTLGIASTVFFNGTKTFNAGTAGLALNGGIIFRSDSMATGQINRLDLIGSGDSTTSSISRAGTFPGTATTSLVKNGTGKWTVTGNYSDTGSIDVFGGTLVFAGSSSGTLGAIQVTGAGTTELKIQAGSYTQGAGGFFVGSGNGAGIVSQTDGTVAWNSTNLQLLIGNGGFAGTYNLSGGSITTLTGTNSRGVMLGVNSGSSATFNLSGTGTLNVNGTSRLMIGRSDSTQVNTTNLFSQTGGTATISDMTMGGTIGGAGSGNSATLTLTGGTFTATAFSLLSAANNDVSTINIGGTAVVTLPAFPTARGSNTTTTINFDGGTLKNSVASTTYMNAQAATSAFIKVGGAQFDTTNGSITITQNLLTHGSSLNGGLTKIGTNTLTLSGTNTYTGATAVNVGTLQAGAAAGGQAFGNGSAVTLANVSGANLDLNGFNQTIGSLAGGGGTGGNVTLGANATLTTGGNNTNTSYAGVISGTGTSGLTKTGSGTQTLTSTNTYTGATNVNNGTLLINGSTSSTSIVTVATVATLGGSGGTVGGATTVNGTLASGSSVGTLNFSNSLALAATSTYLFELNNTTDVADLTNVTGTINIASGATLDLEQLGAYAVGDKFTLFAYLTGSLTGTFNLLGNGAEFTDAGGVWKINYSDTSAGLNGGTGTSFVTISAIPEPSAALLGALGLLTLLRRRRN